MALSPQRIRDTQFKPARRGYEPAEVDAFLEEAAAALEAAQNEATAMEARARAAVARLQELSQAAPDAPADRGADDEAPPAAPAAPPTVTVDEAETISRALLLAQRTADVTVAEAQAEADRLIGVGRDEAARLVEESRGEARRAGESERVKVEGEVQALLARRDFLEADVDHLEQHVVAQRERLTEVAAQLTDLVQRVPAGLGDLRRPLLSPAADDGDPDVDNGTDAIGEDAAAAVGSVDGPADAGARGDATPSSPAAPLPDERDAR